MQYYQRIKELREDHDMSQAQLGARLKMNQKTISQYEKNQRKPTPETIIDLCKIFNVSSDYILGLTDNPTPYN